MYKEVEVEGYLELSKELNIEPLVAKAVKAFNYKKITNNDLKDPYSYKGMEEVVTKIKKHIDNKDKIMIHGDYDCDGICATSILMSTFTSLDYKAGYYIPSRYEDGYGLSTNIIDLASKKGYKLLILVDCGIRNIEEVEYAKSLGLELIILDHHERGEVLPDTPYILHPELSSFSDYNMCAASICLYLSIALLGRIDEYLLTLAGIATIADVMPLIEENRLLAKKAIELLNKHKYPNLFLLADSPKSFDEKVLSFNLIPKINAVGRISKEKQVNQVVKFLVSKDKVIVNKLLNFINDTNTKRKKLSRSHINDLDKDYSKEKIIILKDDNILEGISGLVAASLVNKYSVPVIVLAKSEDEGIYKGSSRSVKGVNLALLLQHTKEFLITYGGHESAAGLSIEESKIESFKDACNSYLENIEIEQVPSRVVSVTEDELTYKAYLQLREYGPFGEANEEPLFIIKDIDSSKVKKSKDGKHLLCALNPKASLVAFSKGDIVDESSSYDFVFTLDKNDYYQDSLSGKITKSYPRSLNKQ